LHSHLVIDTEGHGGRILDKFYTLHPSDLDPGDLHGGTLAETRHGGEHGDEIVGIPPAYLELAETHGKIRQSTETEHDKQTNCDLEVEPFHAAFLLSLSQSIMLV
jgi:hypothetical protein